MMWELPRIRTEWEVMVLKSLMPWKTARASASLFVASPICHVKHKAGCPLSIEAIDNTCACHPSRTINCWK